VFPELEVFSSEDIDDRSGSDLAVARRLNTHLLESNKLTPEHIVVADGVWLVGLSDNVKATVNVSHGTWIGVSIANEIHKFGETSEFLKFAKWQEAAYRSADVVVAVSPMAAWELKSYYNIDSTMIYNGVDLSVFRPAKENKGLVLHVASQGRKQLSMVEDTSGLLTAVPEFLNVKTGDEKDEAARWSQGRVFFQPSLYEGCSYASLEAMACGLVPVSYRTGLFWDLPDKVAIAVDDHYHSVYAAEIHRALHDYRDFKPRKWVEKNASLKKFAANWRSLVGGLR
ncbi:glycosyltransferase, partial [Patescibacteria group bacterium]|nr:glycosyltransferase [Patescibacteria group bacterium]